MYLHPLRKFKLYNMTLVQLSLASKGFGPLRYQNPGRGPTTLRLTKFVVSCGVTCIAVLARPSRVLPVSQCWPVHPVFYLYRSADPSIPCFTCIAVLTGPSRVLPVSQCWPVQPVLYLYRSADQSIPCFTCIAVLTFYLYRSADPSIPCDKNNSNSRLCCDRYHDSKAEQCIHQYLFYTKSKSYIDKAGHTVISIAYFPNVIILKYETNKINPNRFCSIFNPSFTNLTN